MSLAYGVARVYSFPYATSSSSSLSIYCLLTLRCKFSALGGGHTLKKTVMVSTQGALSKFIKRGIQCVGCRATIPEGALCKHCQSKEGTVGQCAFLRHQRSLSASSPVFWKCSRAFRYSLIFEETRPCCSCRLQQQKL